MIKVDIAIGRVRSVYGFSLVFSKATGTNKCTLRWLAELLLRDLRIQVLKLTEQKLVQALVKPEVHHSFHGRICACEKEDDRDIEDLLQRVELYNFPPSFTFGTCLINENKVFCVLRPNVNSHRIDRCLGIGQVGWPSEEAGLVIVHRFLHFPWFGWALHLHNKNQEFFFLGGGGHENTSSTGRAPLEGRFSKSPLLRHR